MSSIPSAGDDTLDGLVDSPDLIQGLAGNDLIRGNGADVGETDQLEGQAGNDTLVTSGSGFGVLDGGTGDDSIVAGAPHVDTGAGGAGNDTLVGDAGTDYLFGDDVDGFGAPPSTASGNDVLDGGDGADLLSGGPGDDILTPGASGNVLTLVDSLRGGDGDDTLALPGDPAGYNISLDGFGNPFVESNALLPGANVRAILDSIETLAFGVTAQQLAAGAAPLTTASLGDLFSPPPTTGRAHFAISDTVTAPTGTQLVAISIARLLANDIDPDGDTLTLQSLTPTGGPGIATFRVIAPGDVASEGYNPALFPQGVLELSLTAPLTAPLRFTYRTTVEAEDGSGNRDTVTGSTATVTLNPVGAADDALRGNYGGEFFIPYATLLANDGPGAAWGGLVSSFILGGTITDDPGRGGIVIDSPGPFGNQAFFSYALAGFAGTADVVVNLDNGAPVAVPLARVVTPGTTFTLPFSEIVGHFGHFDPELNGPTEMGRILGGRGSGATFTVTATGVEVTFAPGYAGGFTLDYTLLDDRGAESRASTISFLTTAPPPPVAVADTLTWGIGDGLSLFDGSRPGYGVVWSRELLANDSFMPGTVRLWNAPFDLTPFDNSQVARVLERGIPGLFGVTDPTDNGFGLEFRPGITTDTLVYTIIDPLGREAQGQITFNVTVPQPQLADNVIVIPAGATSVTLTAADILGNDTFTGAGAIAEVLGIGVGGIVDSGVDIGGGRTGIDRFTVDFNPPGLSPGQPLSVFTLNILTFDTAAAGGSANGVQRVTFVRETAPPPPTTYSLSAPSTALAEGTAAGPLFGFSITRTGTLDAATVTFRTLAGLTGDPAETDDFIAGDGFGTFTVTFAAGETVASRALAFRADAIPEPNETFRIELLGATNTGQAIILDPAASVIEATILDDDAPVFSIAAVNASVLEGTPPGPGGILEFVVTRTGDLSAPATVTWASAPGAANGAEAADVGGLFPFGSVTLAAGQAQATVPLIVIPDDFDEQNETLAVTLTGTTVGTIGAQSSVTFTILDEAGDAIEEGRPPTPTFTLSLVGTDATEGSTPGGGGTITLRIERSGSTAEAATVTYRVGAGTPAAAADDLLGGFGDFTVAFAAGQAFADIVLTAAPDTAIEPNERIEVALVSTTLGAFDGTPVTATILDDDTPPPLPTAALDAATAGTVNEGNNTTATSNTPLEFTIRRSGDLSQAGTVTFVLDAASGGTLTAGDIGLVAAGGNSLGSGLGPFAADFAAGEESKIIFVYAAGDRVPEADEAVRLTLTGGTGATLSSTGVLSATGTFANDDVLPIIALSSASAGSVAEGDAVSGQLQFVITRSGDLSYATEVAFSVAAGAGGATLDDIGLIADGGTSLGFGFGDYAITFNPGETQRIITVFAAGDTVPEADDGFTLTLTGAVQGTLSTTGVLSATGTFTNDDVFPEVALSSASAGSVAEGDAVSGQLQFVITRSGDLSYATEVAFSVAAGAGGATLSDIGLIADGGTSLGFGFGDYLITFNPGETQRIITVFAAGDTVPEADDGFTLTLTGAVQGTLSTTGPLSATGTFTNDDVFPEVALQSASAGSVAEGDAVSGQLQFVITRSGDLSYATEVAFSVAAGAGGATLDDIGLIADGGTSLGFGFGDYLITFNPGETQRIITVFAAGDTVPEADDGFTLTLTGAVQGTLSSTGPLSATGTFTNDDVFPEVALQSASAGSVAEGDAVSGQLQFVITRSGDLSYATEVAFSVAAGAGGATLDDIGLIADGGTSLGFGFGDYVITFNPGETQRIITVVAAGDTVPEADDGFTLTLTGAVQGTLSSTGPLSATGTFTNDDVTPVNTAPVGVADRVGTTRNTAVTFDILANDSDLDGDTLLAGGFTLPANGTLAINGGVITYTPRAGFFGTDSFTYRPFDGAAQGNVTTVTIDVSGPNGDFLVGTPGPDTLDGLGGNDTILGLAAADRLIGNVGDDSISADAGRDTLFGNAGRDTLAGGADDDSITGGVGDDSLLGDAGRDALSGDAGADTLRGGDDADTLNGFGGDDLLDGGEGDDIAAGGAGADTLLGAGGDDTLRGAEGTDSLTGGAGRDTIDGGADNDTLLGGTEADSLGGALGNDSLAGEEGDDTLGGGAGNDTARGGEGRDLIRGAAGDDLLFGDAGDDRLVGGAGADTIEGGADGGAFIFTDGDLTGYRAGDVIDLRGPGGGGDGVADLIIHREGPAGPGSGGLDVILGFEPGLDRILFIDTIGEANGTTRVFNSGDLAGGFFASSGYSLTAGIFIVGVSGVTVTDVNGDWVLS